MDELKTDAEVAKERRAKKRKEQGAVDALILARENKRLQAKVAIQEQQIAEMQKHISIALKIVVRFVGNLDARRILISRLERALAASPIEEAAEEPHI